MLSNDDIDKLILEQGMSLGSGSFDFLSVDEETAITIREIEEKLDQKVESQ